MDSRVLKLVENRSLEREVRRSVLEDSYLERAARLSPLHQVVNYQGSFKPELADYCIRRYSAEGEVVLDPFCGRGTVPLQANLLGRVAWFSDLNPLAVLLARAKTSPVGLDEVIFRLNEINLLAPVDLKGFNSGLSLFYHPQTYRELVNIRSAILKNRDRINSFIEVLVLSRLHGHTSAYFSAYTSPEKCLSLERQAILNARRREKPEYRPVPPRILQRAAQVLQDGLSSKFFETVRYNNSSFGRAEKLNWVSGNTVDLIFSSVPELSSYDYQANYCLEYWFSRLPIAEEKFVYENFQSWEEMMENFLLEAMRVLKPEGRLALVGSDIASIKNKLTFEEFLLPLVEKLTLNGRRLKVEEVLLHNPLTNNSEKKNRIVVFTLRENKARRS